MNPTSWKTKNRGKLKDPLKLITEVGGQSGYAQSGITQILNGRLLNSLRKLVGQKASIMPILSIVSNVDSEEFSNELLKLMSDEFKNAGVNILRMLDFTLGLDDEGLDDLKKFGREESSLALQSKGAQIANQQGFAEFNLVQGQRAALEGLGQGLATGKGTMMMGMGLGGNLTSVRSVGSHSGGLGQCNNKLLTNQSIGN